MDWSTIISIIIGGLGGGLGTFIISWFKERHSQTISSNDQAVAVYKDIVNTQFTMLLAQIKQLEVHNEEIENNYIEKCEECARLETKLQAYEKD